MYCIFNITSHVSEVTMSFTNSELRELVETQLKYTLCVDVNKATNGDIFNAVALAVRYFQQDRFLESQARQSAEKKNAFIISRWNFYSGNHCATT